MKKITLLGCVVFLTILSGKTYAQDVVLNEILASNQTVNADEDGEYSDWVELYNNSILPVNLTGYGISDDPSNLFKWVFPNVEIASGAHVLVWCSDKNRTDPTQPLHTNFKISADGEILTLTRPDGTIEHQVPAMPTAEDVSYGLSTSGGTDFILFSIPTPGAPNAGTSPETLTPPVFSVTSGSFDSAFTLTLTHPDPEATIIYTLDGSEPEIENIGGKTYPYKNQYQEFSGDAVGEMLTGSFATIVYETPLEVTDRSSEPNKIASISTSFHNPAYYIPTQPVLKSTVVRAKAVKNNATPSTTVTNNYFVGSATGFSLPVVSLNVDEDGLFDYFSGIHVPGKIFDDWREANPEGDALFSDANYKQSGDVWQVKGNMGYYVSNAEVLNQDIDIRINGGFNRIYPNKALRLYARSEYGQGNINYPVFGSDYPFDQFKRLILRNSGNDVNQTFFRDAFTQRAVSHFHVPTQPYQPAVIFLNGEYHGLLNFRERYDDKYFERVYGIDGDELDFLEYNGYLVQEGDFVHYDGMMAYLQNNDLSETPNFEHIQTLLDTENFTDFFVANIYAGNTDWPHNNIEFFRKRTSAYEPGAPYGQDGRWRWLLKDTDFGFGGSGPDSYQHNTLAHASSTGGDPNLNPEWSTFIFRKLLENDGFETYFINRFADMINTAYQPQRLIDLIDDMKAVIEGEIPRHGARWNCFTLETWNANVEVMKNFSIERPAYQRAHIQEKFGIGSQISATLDVDDVAHGYIAINTIDLLPSTPGVEIQPYPWTGIYFESVPVTIKAVAFPGFEFSHWSGASESPSPEVVITADADFSLTAHFVPINQAPEIPISFWLADNTLPNIPLSTLSSTYEISNEGYLDFHSCLEGYPYSSGHPLWRKASMERVNSPTDLNYIPEANNDIPFEEANIRGIQVRRPFEALSDQNVLIFNQPTSDYTEIIARIAAKDDNGADAILVDYSVTEPPVWINDGLLDTTLELTADYQLFEIDFSALPAVSDNEHFKFRMRFSGVGLELDNNGRVIFNNVSVSGKLLLSSHPPTAPKFHIYPNPVANILYIDHDLERLAFKLYAIDGRIVNEGAVSRQEIDLGGVQPGVYILVLGSGNMRYTHKIVKK